MTMQQQSSIMEGFVFPTYSCSPPSPASFSTAGHDELVLQFAPCEVPLDAGNDGLSRNKSPAEAAETTTKRRGRKIAGPRTTDDHVEAERQRRDKLHRRFCELRAVVPTVSRMDKASLLADATGYIASLRRRVEQLEAQAKATVSSHSLMTTSSLEEERLEVRMVGPAAAALRLTTAAARHAPAWLMDALRSLDLTVQHACICRVGGVTVQDAVVDVPAAALQDEDTLRAALLHSLQQVSG